MSEFNAASMRALAQKSQTDALAAELKRCENLAKAAASKGESSVTTYNFLASPATCQELRKRGFRVDEHPSTHQLMDSSMKISW